MMNRLPLLLAALMIYAAPVLAKDMTSEPNAVSPKGFAIAQLSAEPTQTKPCAFKDSATINLSFSGVAEDATKISALLDQKAKDLEILAKEKGVSKFDLQSKSMNVNPMDNGMVSSGYNYNGNFNYQVEPSSAAFAILQVASAKGLRAGLSTNTYRQCN